MPPAVFSKWAIISLMRVGYPLRPEFGAEVPLAARGLVGAAVGAASAGN
jgi:hypothetical protein